MLQYDTKAWIFTVSNSTTITLEDVGVNIVQMDGLENRNVLLGGRHKEGRSRGTDHDPTSLEHRKGEGWITVDVVLNIEI